MNCLDIINTVSQAVEAIAFLAGAIFAYLGLETWKKQLAWEKGNKLAEDILLNAYDFQDRMLLFRDKIFPEDIENFKKMCEIFEKRKNKLHEPIARFKILSKKAKIIFRKNTQKTRKRNGKNTLP